MKLGLFPFGVVSALAMSMCPVFSSIEELQKDTYHCFSMGAPIDADLRQLEQLFSFKRVSNILRRLFARICFARQMGMQDISPYTSTVEFIPTVVVRVIAILPRYFKYDQIFQNFPVF
jgi:hypothetical protein